MKFLIFNFLIISNLYANGFEGCGEYQFRGILREKKAASFKFTYIVNEGTTSAMNFELKEQRTIEALMPLLNKPSAFKGQINSMMDGTRGIVEGATSIENRFPNPLSSKDTGIEKLVTKKCTQ